MWGSWWYHIPKVHMRELFIFVTCCDLLWLCVALLGLKKRAKRASRKPKSRPAWPPWDWRAASADPRNPAVSSGPGTPRPPSRPGPRATIHAPWRLLGTGMDLEGGCTADRCRATVSVEKSWEMSGLQWTTGQKGKYEQVGAGREWLHWQIVTDHFRPFSSSIYVSINTSTVITKKASVMSSSSAAASSWLSSWQR